MKVETPAPEETVIKEYPNTTRWLEGERIIGAGNLVLTNKRLAFLHQVMPTDEQLEELRKLSTAPTGEMLDFALALHKKNFQIPVSSLVGVKVGLLTLLPIPRFYLRVAYMGKKNKNKTTSFMFTISILRGVFQLEITTVLGWVWIIRKAMKVYTGRG